MKKIFEIDTDLVQLVPFEVSSEISSAGHQYYQRSMENHGDFTPTGMFKAMRAVVPDTVPGVVEHSGEPCGFVNGDELLSAQGGNPAPLALSMMRSGWHKTAIFTHPPAQPDTAANSGQDAFEAWSKREGRCHLALAIDDLCEDGRFPATYYYSPTETAWRAWANKPNTDIVALQARIVDQIMGLACDYRAVGSREDALIPAYVEQNAYRVMRSRLMDILKAANLAAQTGQEPVDSLRAIGDAWMSQDGRAALAEWIDAHPPAPANSLAIVQATLDAAAEIVDTVAQSEDPLSPEECAAAIRALDKQSIIDDAIKGQS